MDALAGLIRDARRLDSLCQEMILAQVDADLSRRQAERKVREST
jgi:hypothetical protein